MQRYNFFQTNEYFTFNLFDTPISFLVNNLFKCHKMLNTFPFTTFRFPVCHILQAKRARFAMQNVPFCKTLYIKSL